jgi:hypothetical protein
MTETYSGELSREAKLSLSLLFPLIDRWRQRMESPPAMPDADSSIFEDDLATFPYLVSQAVGAQLVSAADHWDALRMLVEDFHVVHARAPFTLLRAAVENSATAVWLLAPASRQVRVQRRLRLEWKSFDDQQNAETALRRTWSPRWPRGRSGSGQSLRRPRSTRRAADSPASRPCTAGWQQAGLPMLSGGP